jgi:hypothetical protein
MFLTVGLSNCRPLLCGNQPNSNAIASFETSDHASAIRRRSDLQTGFMGRDVLSLYS